jgi:hypothetical protein
MDQVLRQEIIEVRGLNEHWQENVQVFNVRPRPSEPKHRSAAASRQVVYEKATS